MTRHRRGDTIDEVTTGSQGGQREFSAGDFFLPPSWVTEHAGESYWWQAVRDVYQDGNLWKVRSGTTSDIPEGRGVMRPNYGAVIGRWKELVMTDKFGLDEVPERGGEEHFPGIDSFNDKIREMRRRASKVLQVAKEQGDAAAAKMAAKVLGHASHGKVDKELGPWADFGVVDAIKGKAPMGGKDLSASRNVGDGRHFHENGNTTMGRNRNESIVDRIDRKLEGRANRKGGRRNVSEAGSAPFGGGSGKGDWYLLFDEGGFAGDEAVVKADDFQSAIQKAKSEGLFSGVDQQQIGVGGPFDSKEKATQKGGRINKVIESRRRGGRRLSEASGETVFTVVTRDGALLYADRDARGAKDFASREQGDMIPLEGVPSDLADKLVDFSQGNTMGAFDDQYDAWQAAMQYADLDESRRRGGRRLAERGSAFPQDVIRALDIEKAGRGDYRWGNSTYRNIGDAVRGALDWHLRDVEAGADPQPIAQEIFRAAGVDPSREALDAMAEEIRNMLSGKAESANNVDVDKLVRENEELRDTLDEVTRAYAINSRLVELPMEHREPFLECIEQGRTFRTLEEFDAYVGALYDKYVEVVDGADRDGEDLSETRVASDPDDPHANYVHEVREGLVEDTEVSDHVLMLAGYKQ